MSAENQEQQPKQQSPEEIRTDIEATREDLGETVEALAEKADVKAQAQQKAEEVKAQAQAKAGDLGQQAKQNQTPITAGAGALLGLVVLLFILRRRRS
jgi:LPXTG-motif cell wall-anchored protein